MEVIGEKTVIAYVDDNMDILSNTWQEVTHSFKKLIEASKNIGFYCINERKT